MRKPVFKRKKVNRVHKKFNIYKHAGRLAAVTAALCLLSGMILTVYGEEKINNNALSKVVVTNIYHKHVGSPEAQGGCYSVEIPHIHAGDEKNGGDCFQIPLPHEHQGDSVSGGGCYGIEIPHVHQDGCYETHSHNDTCFQTIDCQEIYTQVEPYDAEERVCQNHGTTLFNLANSVVVHSDCGKEPENVPISYCQLCGQHQNTRHRVTKKLCAYEAGDIDYDRIRCGKENDGAVDGYERNCGFENGETESYGISCGKKTDGYEVGCNLTTHEPLGKLILTSKAREDGRKAAVNARVEDLSFGKLILSDEPFIWKDAMGNVIGNDDVVEVAENGNYSVTLKLENRDVEESGLHSSILVDGIYKEEIRPTSQPSQTPGASPSPSAGTGEKDKGDNEKGDEKDDNGDEENDNGDDSEGDDSGSEEGDGNENDGNVTKEKTEGSEKKAEDFSDGLYERNISDAGKGSASSDKKSFSATPSSSPQNRAKMTKQTAAVHVKEAKTSEEMSARVQHEERKTGIFSLPAVRVITITAGVLLLIIGILLLPAYLLHSVKVYNDNGEGKMCYLGRCLVHREDDMYFLTISDTMVEKSYTNRYCIKPGLFRLGKEDDDELTVYKETKKAIVSLNREMIVMI